MDTPSRVDKPIKYVPKGTLDISLEPSENIPNLPPEEVTHLVLTAKDVNPDDSQIVDKLLEDTISDENKEKLKPIKTNVTEVYTEAKPDETMEEQTKEGKTEHEVSVETSPENNLIREIGQGSENPVVSSDNVDHPIPTRTPEENNSDEVIHTSYELVEEKQGKKEQIEAEMVKLESTPENEQQDEPAHIIQPLGTPPSYETFLRSQGGKAAGEIPEVQTSEPQQQSTSNATPNTSTSLEAIEVKPVSKPPGVSKDGSVHQIKWVQFEGVRVPIITQNENGPCPMIAITNVLLLRQKISLPKDHEMVSSDLIIQTLSDELFSQSIAFHMIDDRDFIISHYRVGYNLINTKYRCDSDSDGTGVNSNVCNARGHGFNIYRCTLSEWSGQRQNFDEETRANYEENLSSAVSIFPKLQTGLDINVRFTGSWTNVVADFEYTTALTVFDLFRIPIFHGWVVDPQDVDLVKVLNNQTYNQVVEMIIDYKTSMDSVRVHKGLVAEEFLESTASQLTLCGLCELNDRLREGELAVFFRNNHFNTIYKKKVEKAVSVEVLHMVINTQAQLDTLNWEVF
ncbi:hypothetical protein ACTXT7_002878 [Hymenolepis weldensis]